MSTPMSLHRFVLYAALLSLILSLGPAACSLQEQRPIEKPPAPASLPPASETERKPDIQKDQKEHAAEQSEKPASSAKAPGIAEKTQVLRSHIEAGEFITALHFLDLKDRQLNAPTDVARLYRKAVNGTISQGQSRLADGKPGEAGMLFRAALNNYPHAPRLADKIALTPGQLESKVAVCAEKLMEQGLTVYRKGHLNKAIQIWQEILAFAPHHEASQNAIRTAHIQLNNLKKIESPPASEIR